MKSEITIKVSKLITPQQIQELPVQLIPVQVAPGQPVSIKALPAHRYELINSSTGQPVIPKRLLRRGKDLEVLLDDDLVLRLEDFNNISVDEFSSQFLLETGQENPGQSLIIEGSIDVAADASAYTIWPTAAGQETIAAALPGTESAGLLAVAAPAGGSGGLLAALGAVGLTGAGGGGGGGGIGPGNSQADALKAILEDSASTGGMRNADSTPVSLLQLQATATKIDPALLVKYQEAIAATTTFSNPPTVPQVQAVIDRVNTNALDAQKAILEDSNSPGGGTSTDKTPVSADQLTRVAVDVNPDLLAQYRKAIAATDSFSNPPTVAEVQTVIDQVNALARAATGAVLEDSSSKGGGNNTDSVRVNVDQLNSVAVNVDPALLPQYQHAISATSTFSNPPTVPQVQAVIDLVNGTALAARNAILEDSASSGGNNNADRKPVDANQLQSVATGVEPRLISQYQLAIAGTTTFSNPPTVAQVQAVIDKVNANVVAALRAILEDSGATGGNNNNDGQPVSLAQLQSVASKVDPLLLSKYQTAIAVNTTFSSPPTLAQIQALVDSVNADTLAAQKAILEDSSSTGGARNVDNLPVTVEQLDKVATQVDPELLSQYRAAILTTATFSDPPSLAQVQAVIDKVNADALTARQAVLEDSRSQGGAANNDGIKVTQAQLEHVAVHVNPALLDQYQRAIAETLTFTNPPTVAEIQKVIDLVNQTALAAIYAIQEDSRSPGGADNKDTTAVSQAQLESVAQNVNPALLDKYRNAINAKTDFSNPPTLSEIQTLINMVNAARATAMLAVLEDSNSPDGKNNTDGTKVSFAQLDSVAANVNGNLLAEYQKAIASTTTFSNPPTVTQVQAVIDKVNADALAARNAILEDSTSPGGSNNADNTPVTAQQLDAVAENVDPALLKEYQKAIARTTSFSNPPTVAQVQVLIDKVNADALAARNAILEDSTSPGGGSNADNTPVTIQQLDAVAENVNAALLAQYQKAIAGTPSFSNPPTVAQVQAVIDKVNADAVAVLNAVLEDSGSPGGGNNNDNTRVSTGQLESVSGNVDPALIKEYQKAIGSTTTFSNPPTLAQVQAIIDKVNADALTARQAILEDSTSGGGKNNADATSVTTQQLDAVAENVDPTLLKEYQKAIGSTTTFSNPPTVAQVQAVIDKVNADALAARNAILEDSTSPGGNNNADNTPVTAQQLDAVAENVDPALLKEYQQAIAGTTSFSNPPTVAQVQAVIDKVNADALAARNAILEDSTSPGGSNNADNTPVTAQQLDAVAENVDPTLLKEYQKAIGSTTTFSNPPTVAQVQAVIDQVNATALAARQAILEDSTSTGGSNNADNTPVTAQQLDAVAENVDPTLLKEYQKAIGSTTTFSNPPTVAQVQAVIDKVNADALAARNAILEDSTSPGGSNNADNTPVTAQQLDAVAENVDPALLKEYQKAIAGTTSFSNPPTVTQVQAVIDQVNATALAARQAILEDSTSPGGSNNADNTPVTAQQLDVVAENVDPALLKEYQQAIAGTTSFSNPPTVAQVQAVIDQVNAGALTALKAILEDSVSPGGRSNADNTRVSFLQLDFVAENVRQDLLADYQNAIAGTRTFSNPPTVAQVQAIIDRINASALQEVVEDIAGNINQRPSTAAQLNGMDGVSGAQVDYEDAYATALASAAAAGWFADAAAPTGTEVNAIVQAYNRILGEAGDSDGAGTDGSNNNPILQDYAALGINVAGLSANALSLINDRIGKLSTTDLDTVPEVRAIVEAARHVMDTAAGTATLTLDDLRALGISGFTTATLPSAQQAIDSTANTGSAVNTLGKLRAVLSLPTTTAAITSVTDDQGDVTGILAEGAWTDDAVLDIRGTYSATLGAGERVVVYDGSTRLGVATVNSANNTWSFTNTTPFADGQTLKLRAVVETATLMQGSMSPATTLHIDTTALALEAQTSGSIASSADLQLQFNMNVQLGSGSITLYDSANPGVAVQTLQLSNGQVISGGSVSTSGQSVTINLANTLVKGRTYYATVDAGVVRSVTGNDFPGLTGPSAWTFKAVDPATTVNLSGPGVNATDGINASELTVLRVNGIVSSDDFSVITNLTIGAIALRNLDTGNVDARYSLATGDAMPDIDPIAHTWSYELPGSLKTLLTDGARYAVDVSLESLVSGQPSNSVATSLGALIDYIAPATPAMALANDTGISGDGITSQAQVNITGLEPDAIWQYQIDNGAWTTGSASSFSLIEGTHSYAVRQIDKTGNVSTVSSSRSYKLESAAPGTSVTITGLNDDVGSITGKLAKGSFTDDTQLQVDGTLGGATAGASLAGGETLRVYDGSTYLGNATVTVVAGGQSTWSFSDTRGTLVSGDRVSYTARVANSAGNEGTVSNAYEATIDTIAPAAPGAVAETGASVLTDGYLNGTESGNPISVRVSLPAAGSLAVAGDQVELLLGTNSFGTPKRFTLNSNDIARGYLDFSVAASDLGADGSKSLKAQITDQAGNLGAVSPALSFTLDTAAPTIQIDTVASNDEVNSQERSAGVTVSGTTTAEVGQSVSVQWGNTTKNVTVLAGAGGVNTWSVGFAAADVPSDGSTTVIAKVSDVAGNAAPTASKTVVIDTTVQNVSISSTIDTNNGITSTITSGGSTRDSTLGLNGTAEAGSTVEIFVDGVSAGLATLNGTSWSHLTSALTDGSHRFKAKITDAAGNTATTSEVSATVSSAVSKASINSNIGTDSGAQSSISSGGSTQDGTLTLTGKAETGSTVQIYSGTLLLGTATLIGEDWSFTTSALADGTYTFRAEITNSSGNSVSTSEVTATVDNAAPTATLTAPGDGNIGIGISGELQLTFSEAVKGTGTGNILIKKLSDDSTVVALDGSSAQLSGPGSNVARVYYSGLSAGTAYYVVIQGGAFVDAAGNAYAGLSSTGTAGWDFTTADPAISLNAVAGDNYVNAAENGQTIQLSGAISSNTPSVVAAYSSSGLTVKLVPIGGGSTVNAGNITYDTTTGQWTADVPANTLLNGRSYTVLASASATNYSTVDASNVVVVDTSPPSAPTNVSVKAIGGTEVADTLNGTNTAMNFSASVTAGQATGGKAEFYVNGVLIGVDDNIASGDTAVSYNTGTSTTTALQAAVTSGGQVAVKLYDAAGNLVSANGPTLVRSLTPPSAPTAAPTQFYDDEGSITGTSTAAATDDTQPGIFIGTGLTDTPSLYVDGVRVTATYDNATGRLTPTTALSTGTRTLSYTLTDVHGNESAASPGLSLTVDTSVSLATIDATITTDAGLTSTISSGDVTKDTTLTFTGKAEAGSTVEIYDGSNLLGTATLTGTDWTYTTSALSDGTYNVTAKVTDAVGNVQTTATWATATVDTTAPAAPTLTEGTTTKLADGYLNASEAGTSTSLQVTLSTAGSAAVAGDSVELLLGGVPFSTAKKRILTSTDITNGSVSFTVSKAELGADGIKALTAQITDVAGNPGTVSSALSFTLDTGAPSAPTLAEDTSTKLADGYLNSTESGSSTSIKVSLPQSGALAAAGDAVELLLGGLAFGTAKTVTLTSTDISSGYVIFSVSNTDLGSDGAKSLSARITDAAGNVGTASTSLSFTLDTAAPSAPSLAEDTTTKLADSYLNASEIDSNTPISFQVGLPSSGTKAVAGDTVELLLGGLPFTTAKTVVLSNSDITNGSVSLSVSLADLGSDGGKSLTARIIDAAGNLGAASGPLGFTLSATAPTTTASVTAITDDVGAITGSVASGGVTDDTSLAVSGTLSASLSAGQTVRIYDGNTFLATAAVTGTTWSYTDTRTLMDGQSVSYTARVADAAGNQSAAGTAYTATVDTSAPSANLSAITLDLDSASDAGNSNIDNLTNVIQPSVTVSTLNGLAMAVGDVLQVIDTSNSNAVVGSYTVQAGDLSAGAWSGTTQSITLTSALTDGAHALKVRLADAAGNAGTPNGNALTVNVDTAAPTLGGAAPSTALGSAVAGSAGDSPGETIVLTLNFDSNVYGLTSGSDSTVFQVAGTGVSATWGGTDGSSTRTLTYTVQPGQNGQASIDEAALKTALATGLKDLAGNAFAYTANGGNIANIDSTALPIVDTTAPTAPTGTHTVALSDDTGTAGDRITSDASVKVTLTLGSSLTLASGEKLQVSADGGSTWVDTTGSGTSWATNDNAVALQSGSGKTLTARLIDSAGNTTALTLSNNAYTLVTSAPTTTVAVTGITDNVGIITGNVASGGVTDDTTPTLSGTLGGSTAGASLATGETLRVYNGTTYLGNAAVTVVAGGQSTWSYTHGSAFADGTALSLSVRVADAAGNEGTASTAYTATVDTTAPSAPTGTHTVAISDDTGTAGDRITSDASVKVTLTLGNSLTLASGEKLQVSADGGSTWVDTTGSGTSWATNDNAVALQSGSGKTITARLIDSAGNTTALTLSNNGYTLDTSVSAPSLALASDTGSSTSDGLTNNAQVNVSGLEAGATWQYQINSSGTWINGSGTSFNLSAGSNTYVVRQTDAAGNVSASSSSSTFNLDSTAPTTAGITLSDVDANSSYSANDTLTLSFSEAVASTLALSDLTVNNSRVFGTGATLSAVSPSSGRATQFLLTLGTGTTVTVGDLISVDRTKLADLAGNTPAVNLSFTAPSVFAPRLGSAGVGDVQVTSSTSGNQMAPKSAALNDGGYVLVWAFEQPGSVDDWDVYAQRYDAYGAKQGGEFRVNASNSGVQGLIERSTGIPNLDVTGLSGGGFAVTWMSDHSGGNRDIYTRRFGSDGSALDATDTLVNTYRTSEQVVPQIARLDGGGYVIVWASNGQDGSGGGVYGQRFNADGTAAGSEFKVNDITANNQGTWFGNDDAREEGLSVVGVDGGGFLVVWGGENAPGTWDLYAQRYDASGTRVTVGNRTISSQSGNQVYPSVTALAGGGFLVAWVDTRSTSFEVFAQRLDDTGQPVGSEFQVNTVTAQDQGGEVGGLTDRMLDVTALVNGGWVVTWCSEGQDGSLGGIYMQVYDSQGRKIGNETKVNSVTNDTQLHVTVTALGDGGFVVGWDSNLQDGSNWGVYQKVYEANGLERMADTTRDVLINTTTSGEQLAPKSATLADGGYVLVWASIQGGTWDVFAQIYDVNGLRVGSEFRVNDTLTGTQGLIAASTGIPNLDVAGLTGGGFAVTWMSDHQGGTRDIYSRRFSSTGAALDTADLRVNTYTADEQIVPQMASLEGGGYVIVWVSNGQDGSGGGVYGQRFNASGSAEGSEFRVNTLTANNQGTWFGTADAREEGLSVVGLKGGGFVVVWGGEPSSGTWDLYGQRYDASGNPIGANFTISAKSGNQVYPSVTALADGGFVLLWVDNDSSGLGVYAQRYNASGAQVGTDFLVNTTVSGNQGAVIGTQNDRLLDVAGLANGGWVAVWNSEGQDGSSGGIYMQVYNSQGVKVGSETRVHTYTPDMQIQVTVSAVPDGGFVVAWDSFGNDGNSKGIFHKRFNSDGSERAGETWHTSTSSADPLAVAIAPDLLVSSAGLTTMSSAKVRIDNYKSGDELAFTAENGITASWDSATGVLTLSGSATLANYQAALRKVTFNNKSANPSLEARTFSFDLTDSSGNTSQPVKAKLTLYETPLMLDLNGDGVRTMAVGEGVLFDVDADGTPTLTGWTDGLDGLLALDLNADGLINDGRELFGSGTRLADGTQATDGYQALAQYDTHADGRIDAQDSVFEQLRVWIDANQDGLTDAGELRTLAELGIASLSLAAQSTLQVDQGNVLGLSSHWTDAAGVDHAMADVWLSSQSLQQVVLRAAGSQLADLTKDAGSHSLAITLEQLFERQQDWLVVKADSDDVVSFQDAGWTDTGVATTVGDHTYALWSHSGVHVLIDQQAKVLPVI